MLCWVYFLRQYTTGFGNDNLRFASFLIIFAQHVKGEPPPNKIMFEIEFLATGTKYPVLWGIAVKSRAGAAVAPTLTDRQRIAVFKAGLAWTLDMIFYSRCIAHRFKILKILRPSKDALHPENPPLLNLPSPTPSALPRPLP